MKRTYEAPALIQSAEVVRSTRISGISANEAFGKTMPEGSAGFAL